MTAAAPPRMAGFVDAFTGSHRFVLDYLVEEVLNSQPDDVRRFLLDTSVLQQLTGPLCDALTGRDDGRQTLEILERGNLFVVPLDDQRQWYCYHHLFADALRARLLAQHPDRVPGCTGPPAAGTPNTACSPTLSSTRSQAMTSIARPIWSSSRCPTSASTGRTVRSGSGCVPCRTGSSGGALSWSPSWPGRGSPKVISMGPRCGSMTPGAG